MKILLLILLWPIADVIAALIRVTLGPHWRRFVGLLSGPRVVLLWAAVLAAMVVAWDVAPVSYHDEVLVGRMLLFMGAPVLAVAATFAWRGRDRPRPPPWRRGAY